MAIEQFLRFVFVLYCVSAGVVLLLAPWTPGWDLMLAHVPILGLRWLGVPWLRGALSGFGLVHLIWALHDLGLFLRPNDWDDNDWDDGRHGES